MEVLVGKLYNPPFNTLVCKPENWIEKVDQCKLLMEKIFKSLAAEFSGSAANQCMYANYF